MEALTICTILLVIIGSGTTGAVDPPKEVFLQHTLSPLAICDENRPVDPHKKIEECHALCNYEPISQGRSELTIYKDNSASKKYTAVMCEKWILTQTFTQTWTFSTIKGDLVKERVKPNEAECIDTIAEKCNNWICEYHLPTELAEEYFYASTNVKTKEFIIVITVPAIMIHYDGDYHIHIAHEKESFRANASPWNTGMRIYSWLTKEGEGCPFDAGMTVGCDKWKTGESVNFICGNGRLAFEASGSTDLGSRCPIGTRMSPEGIIYQENRKKPASEYNSQRISMYSENKLAADTETLRVLTSNSLIHLDADLCAVGCEVSGLELRVGRRHSTLIRTGAGYVLLSPKGHGYDCSKAVQCSIVKPYKFCGDPPRIHVMCNGKFYFWNPTQSFILLDNGCHAPSSAENLYIHLGNHKYSLDDDLTVSVLANETDNVRTAGYAIGRGSLIGYEDIPELRSSWLKLKNSPKNYIETNATRMIDQHSIFDPDWFSPIRNLTSWVGSSINNMERAIVVIAAIVFCAYISKPILMYVLGKHAGRARPGVFQRIARNQPARMYEVEMI